MKVSIDIAKKALRARQTERLSFFKPYDYQVKFIESSAENNQILLMAANRSGKTYCGATVMAIHATGLYPEWWGGRKFPQPIKAWCGGQSNTKARDICQAELLGEVGNPDAKGTGAIPLSHIGDTVRLPGVPNAVQTVFVKHVTGGWSSIHFKSYEMGPEAWMGESVNLVWLDEEPPQSILSQAMIRTLDKQGLTYMTFTPENGVTEVVASFMNEKKPGQDLITASWDDAPHLDEKAKEQILSSLPPHERELRSKGIPVLGSGLVYPIDDKDILCDPFPIPAHYPRLVGLDMGWDHSTAAVWAAWNLDTDTVYLYDCYKAKKQVPEIHAAAIKARGAWTVIWPHDGNRRDSYGGPTLADQYRKLGVKMHYQHFSNPPAPGEKEGQGGNAVEPGIMEILSRMNTGRFKVFSTMKDWFDEKRMYHRKDGVIVTMNDDLMAATRYAVMSRRFANTGITKNTQETAEHEFNIFAY